MTLPSLPALELTEQSSYYERHIFFCVNQREGGEASCSDHKAADAYARCKSQVKAAGLSAPGQVRVNQAGCLNRCAAGPVAVVYPEAVWYTYVDLHDVDEIVESHLKNGVVVERLRTPAHLGR
ncbi:MAG TPA: (2Fe-2S) ferredoxin domain-containing protein [Polaromonas sp.]|uniref:(2Fe-2S) ferredoxin domain-containing protein n=1 Tax=Polaromonas sp. TaxID=1869339 RepID=UPI002D26649C|nr:(2Fe-2S) ferredoxin domain-containing protein [Polaromonas sp.]HYW58260.1 (2Fe-2S) ferredoxin domain-containing protein [Polaromonas sp.]